MKKMKDIVFTVKLESGKTLKISQEKIGEFVAKETGKYVIVAGGKEIFKKSFKG